MDLVQLIRNLTNIDVWEELSPVLKRHENEFIEANKEQLISGETNKGEMIRPKYTEDPYFKSRGQALGYARWKKKLEDAGQIPRPKIGTKYFTAPNFFIKGNLHSNIRMKVLKEGLSFDAEGFGQGFDSKWRDMYGVTDANLKTIVDADMASELAKSILEKLQK